MRAMRSLIVVNETTGRRRTVIDLAFEKNLMRANAVDFKNSSVGVVDFMKTELVPVLMVMNHGKGAMPGAGASMAAAGAA